MMMLCRHMVYPHTADRIALDRRLPTAVVQIGHPRSQLRNARILVAIHNSLLPEALLALREHQLRQRLEGLGIHVFWWIRHSQFGEDGSLDVGEHACSETEVVGSGLEAIGATCGSVDRELRVKSGEVVEDVHELKLEVVTNKWSLSAVAQSRIPAELSTDLNRVSNLICSFSCVLWYSLTSIGNLPPIQTSCPAYVCNFATPVG